MESKRQRTAVKETATLAAEAEAAAADPEEEDGEAAAKKMSKAARKKAKEAAVAEKAEEAVTWSLRRLLRVSRGEDVKNGLSRNRETAADVGG